MIKKSVFVYFKVVFIISFFLVGCGQNKNYIESETNGISSVQLNSFIESESEEKNLLTENINSPFAVHGAISVNKTDLVDKNGEKFQLYGMSTHGIAWFPQYINKETFRTLRDDWKTNCVRLAMYTEEYGGYCSGGNKEALKALIKNGVNYANELGMYVIIDWHILNDKNPNLYIDDSKAFFNEMSALYSKNDNVIYEICNEPNSSTSWEDIKKYANEIIPIIRANDTNAIVIVGTPEWSQKIDEAAASPLQFDNVMYSLHFYAATHTDWLRERTQNCINQGLPIFISEFGMCDASGSGNNNFEQTQKWFELIQKNNLSYCCWNLANKDEKSSVILPWCNKISDWGENELSESGKIIRQYFKNEDVNENL